MLEQESEIRIHDSVGDSNFPTQLISTKALEGESKLTLNSEFSILNTAVESRRKTDATKFGKTRAVIRVLRHASLQSKQSGFTIVEALMAIIVASALMVAIAPIVTLSAAARVQARRVDLATQAARGYIDGLRANSLDPPSLTRRVNFNSLSNQEPYLGVPAPSAMRPVFGVEQCLDKNLNQVNCNINSSNNPPLLAIQAFRNGPTVDGTNTTVQTLQAQGYCVGVRVYRADAFQGGAPTFTKPSPSAIATSLNSKNYPLVVMTAQIINQINFKSYSSGSSGSDYSPCK